MGAKKSKPVSRSNQQPATGFTQQPGTSGNFYPIAVTQPYTSGQNSFMPYYIYNPVHAGISRNGQEFVNNANPVRGVETKTPYTENTANDRTSRLDQTSMAQFRSANEVNATETLTNRTKQKNQGCHDVQRGGCTSRRRRSTDEQILMDDPPYWYNPCGTALVGRKKPAVGNNDYYDTILLSIYYAMNHILAIREEYCQMVFGQSFSQMIDNFGRNSYSWLPVIPKKVGEVTPSPILPFIELEKFTICTYSYLQRYAVGLEESAFDMDERNLKKRLNSAEEFMSINEQLRALLCTLRLVMSDASIPVPTPVSRGIMPTADRDPSSESATDIRDFIIFKDYTNGLEFFRDVYEYFKKQTRESNFRNSQNNLSM